MVEESHTFEFEVVVERDEVLAAEAAFRRIQSARTRTVIGRQNDVRFVSRRNAFRLVQVLAPLGWFLSVFVVLEKIDRGAPLGDVLPWGGVAFGLFLLAGCALITGSELADELMFKLTDRLWASSSRRTVEVTARVAPFTATYACSPEEWVTRIDDPAKEMRLRRSDALEVDCDGDVCLVYRGRFSQRFTAVVWAKAPEVRDALLRFARNGDEESG